MARGERLQGDPQVGRVKVYQLVPILTRTPGSQVGLLALQGYLAHEKHPPPRTLQKDYA
jgi:hypothetical protein